MKPGLWDPLESSSRIFTYLRKSAMLCTASSCNVIRCDQITQISLIMYNLLIFCFPLLCLCHLLDFGVSGALYFSTDLAALHSKLIPRSFSNIWTTCISHATSAPYSLSPSDSRPEMDCLPNIIIFHHHLGFHILPFMIIASILMIILSLITSLFSVIILLFLIL